MSVSPQQQPQRQIPASVRGRIDFTLMFATHRAFRRDLDRFVAATAAGAGRDPGVRAGWENFKRQLQVHHTVEDAELWPAVERAVAGRADALALLGEMEAEHAGLDPLLADVDRAMADPGRGSEGLAARVRELASALGGHMAHEEEAALPLIDEVLAPEDWDRFRGAMARSQGPKGAAVYVPWVVDGAAAEDRRAFFGAMPPPVRLANRLLLERRYRRRGLWGRETRLP